MSTTYAQAPTFQRQDAAAADDPTCRRCGDPALLGGPPDHWAAGYCQHCQDRESDRQWAAARADGGATR